MLTTCRWLDGTGVDAPRIFTFFGLVPNFDPMQVADIFRAVLRPGDTLVVSAHLAPVDQHVDTDAALRKVLPQYDNAETRAWLNAALDELGLDEFLEEPAIVAKHVKNFPLIVALSPWKSGFSSNQWGSRKARFADTPFVLFVSRRFTPALFEEFLQSEGFAAERMAITSCREEAIWAVRL